LTWLATLALFGAFACVSLYKALSGYATCGCFGKIEVNPWYTATLDIFIVLSLLCYSPRRSKRPLHIDFKRVFVRVAYVLAIWFVLGVPAALAMGTYSPATLSDAGNIIGDGRTVVLTPDAWVGQRFPLLRYIDIGGELAQGSWTVLLYHHDCPKCQETISRLREFSRESVSRGPIGLALAEIPPYHFAGPDATFDDLPCVRGNLDDRMDWFVEAPLIVTLSDGRVLAVMRYEDVLVLTEQGAGST